MNKGLEALENFVQCFTAPDGSVVDDDLYIAFCDIRKELSKLDKIREIVEIIKTAEYIDAESIFDDFLKIEEVLDE